jgi:hypothetical protein
MWCTGPRQLVPSVARHPCAHPQASTKFDGGGFGKLNSWATGEMTDVLGLMLYANNFDCDRVLRT